jgi:hypothetical protein
MTTAATRTQSGKLRIQVWRACIPLDSSRECIISLLTHSPYRSRGSRRVRQTVEVRQDRSRTPVRIVREPPRPTTERIVVEEHRETRRDSASAASSDEVVVIEEHSPPRRPKSKRDSGYRTVDPLAYGGSVGGRSARDRDRDRRSRR